MAEDRSSDDDGTVGLTTGDRPADPVSDVVTRTTPPAGLDESRPDTVPPDEADDLSFLAPALGPGELGRLGGYKVLRVLGAGGMGVVLEAEDPRLGRRVAVKVMRPRTAGSTRAVERFLREARSAAAVEHDHIVPIYFVGEENRVPFIVMPFLKGEPLDGRLRREGTLPVAEAVRIARDVAEGLAAAHAAGLVHRDVKPGNLWLEAPRGRVKILDFGLARPGGDDTHLTHSGQIIGTPAYMAPEQGRGRAVDARTDLFSLGAVLYRMVAGRPPFDGPDTMSLLTALATDTPVDPRILNPGLPLALAQLILRLLEKDPARRPQSAREVADALSPGVEHLPATRPEAEFAFDVEAVTEEMPADRARRTGRAAWLGWVAAALLVFGGGGFLGYKLFFETPTGTLVLEVSDPAVEARFKNGEVQLLDSTGQVKYTLRPGERKPGVAAGDYQVQVTGADGIRLDTHEFTLRKGGEVVIRATLVPPAAAPPVAVASKDSPDRRAALAFKPFAYNMNLRFPNGGRMQLDSASVVPGGEFTLVAVNFWPGPQLPADFVSRTFLPAVQDLRGLEGVSSLDPANPITAAELARLAGSRAAATLTNLHVTSCELTPGTLETLKKFPNLQTLSCSAHGADDALLARLGELPGLTALWLKGLGKGAPVTAVGMTALAARPLRELTLWAGGITDPALYRPLAAMPGLTTLDLNQTPVGDAVLNELTACRALTSLRLTSTRVTDAGLARLSGMRTLTWLWLYRAPVTAAGVKVLAAALPNCRIESDHGNFGPGATATPTATAGLPARPVTDFRAAHGLSPAELQAWFDGLPARFRPAVLTARAGAPVPTFDAVAVNDGGPYVRQLTFVRPGEDYNALWNQLRSVGYRMVQGATCLVDGRPRLFALAWVKDGVPWTSRHGNEAWVRERLATGQTMGYRPVSLEGNATQGGVVLAKDPGAKWSAEFDVPAADLARRVVGWKFRGWRPDILTPDLGEGLRFTVVAVRPADPAGWAFETGLTPDAFAAALETRRATGFHPHHVASHVADGKVGYTVVWLGYTPGPPLPFFNGQDLNGWVNRANAWKLVNGTLVSSAGARAARIMYSDRAFADFELAFKVRMTGPAGHVGVLFRAAITEPAAGTGLTVHGPRWLLTDGMTAEALTFAVPAKAEGTPRPDLKRDDFNDVVLRCVGRRLTVTVNGKVGIDREENFDPTGRIGWLHGGGGGEATIKDIKFTDLSKPPPAFRWRDLFESRKLAGWTPVGDSSWASRDGVLVGDGAAGWLMSDAAYRDFELNLEYRLPPGGDGGVFLRAWPDADVDGGKFLEVQLLDDAAPRDREFRPDEKTGALYGLVGPKTPPKAPAGEWNALKVRLVGSRLTVTVNGSPTIETDLTDHVAKALRIPGLLREDGRIGLQSCRSRVEYRNVRVAPIEKGK